jgi:DNA mismatch repair protein MutL
MIPAPLGPVSTQAQTQTSTNAAAPRRVRPLPDALIDQIAAGEVVERPASVVKELVENSLDAGAMRVRIELRDGGREFIAVTDDGCGMTPQDARLALQRHATSKIHSADDLARIATYGFRGEALPAIASVASLCLRTRTASADAAIELRVEQGRLVGEGPAGAPPGTRVEVADLFAGIPARRKFLKAASTEWGHVADWLARAALALPHVHLEIRRDDRPAQIWSAARDLLDRAAAVLGEQEAAGLVPVQLDEGRVSVAGLVSRPDRHRPTLGGVHLFVNRRPVRDRLMQHALVEAYRAVLPRGRFPSAVLFVSVPAQAVDVNVHPAKWEVRFADPQSIHRLVRGAARQALGERRWLSGAPAAPADGPATRRGPGASDWVLAVREPSPLGPRSAGGEPEPAALPGLGTAPAARLRFADLPLIGQLLATYLVLETRDGLLLVDQHAAHERVLYERLREQWRCGAVESQGLIAPEPVTLDPARRAALADAAAELLRLGFDLEPFGGDAVAVRAVPALLAERDPAGLVRDLADRLAADASAGSGEPSALPLDAADRVFASLACHAARRKGDLLDPREQRALLDAVDAIPWAPTCPHGRPVAVPWELAEIERRFARR